METAEKWVAPDASLATEVRFVSLPAQQQARLREFLQAYGYLDRSRDLNALDPSVDDCAALAQFQRFVGLTGTGKFDADTQKLMNEPRCGFPDVHSISEFALSGCKWNKRVITWRLVGGSEDLPVDRVRQAMRSASGEWDRHMPNNSLQEVLSGPADITVLFARRNHGDGHNFDGPGRILAHAYFPPPCGGRLAGDIHFDEDERWTDAFLMQVALHEIGHSLGLAHSNDPNAVMYPIFRGRSRLATDDIAGIRRLYP